MKKSKSKEARRKKLYNKLIQTAMIHEAIFAQTLQRVFQRKKSQEQEKINTLLQHFHSVLPMGCMKESNRLNRRYAFRWLSQEYS